MDNSEKTKEELIEEIKELQQTIETLKSADRERVWALDEMKKSQDRLTLALWAANLAWWDWDYKSGFVAASRRKAEMLGYKPEDISPHVDAWIERIHPNDYEMAMKNMADHLKGKTPIYEVKYRLRTKKGTWKWFWDRGKIVERSDDGRPVRITGTVQDIDYAMKTEVQFERLFNFSRDLLAIHSFDGYLRDINPAWSRILGWSPLELKEKPWIEFIHKDDRAKTEKIFSKLMAGESIPPYSIRFKTENDQYKWLSWNSFTLEDEKLIMSVIRDETEKIEIENELEQHRHHLENLVAERTKELASVNEKLHNEIDERKQIEENLLQSEKELRASNATKDRFFSIMAHDLKSPFQGLLGLSDILARGSNTLGAEKIKDYSVSLHQTAKSVYSLLENLLEWSRAQLGRLEIRKEAFELHSFIELVLSINSASANKKGISIINEVDTSLKVYSDKNMLDTVLRNLISNAMKFTNAHGEIKIKAKRHNNLIEVTVSDNGIGISPDIREKLFKIDQKVTTIGTGEEKGTGLGLILCKEFIESQGGNIWIESEHGKGSDFIFTIEAADSY